MLGQQVNVRFALDVKARLVRRFGTTVTHAGRTYHGFPTPDALAAADAATLRALRISRQKARYITGIVQRVREGAITDAVGAVKPKGNVFVMRYSGPYTPWFLRRNEVAIEVEWDDARNDARLSGASPDP